MSKSAASSAEARFKQLCSMGLGREAVAPALFAELRALIPNSAALAFFIENDKLVGGYTDNPEAAHTRALYFGEFHGRRGRELGGAFPDNVRTQYGVQDHGDALGAIGVDDGSFKRSDFFNLIYRPLRVGSFMRLMVRDHAGRGRAVGSLTIYRGPKDRPWGADEKRRFAALESFLALAMQEESRADLPLTNSGRSGLIVTDITGKPVYFSSWGRHLLDLVVHPRQTAQTAFDSSTALPAPVTRLCSNLVRVFSDVSAAEAPVYHHRNILGGFTFRAHWLDGGDRASSRIGITVTHEEPAQVKLLRRVGTLPLTRRQAEVCFLLANGNSHETIAERLAISKHTAITHGRWIYNKLDVHNRAELVNLLLSEELRPVTN